MAEEDSEDISFDDLDLGGGDDAAAGTGDALDDLEDLDLGPPPSADGDGASDLFADLDGDPLAEKPEGEAGEGGEEGKKSPLAALKGNWQYPVLGVALAAFILHFFVFPPDETVHGKMKNHRQWAEDSYNAKDWQRAMNHLDTLYSLEEEQEAKYLLMLADSAFGTAVKYKAEGDTGVAWDKFNKAAGHYNKALTGEDYKETWTPTQRFYIQYQLARALFENKKNIESRKEFLELQTVVDVNRQDRLRAEKEGLKADPAEEVFPREKQMKLVLSEDKHEILNYLGLLSDRLEEYTDAISYYLRYVERDAKLRSKQQLQSWIRIGEAYHNDGDQVRSREWFKRAAEEYSDMLESKVASFRLAELQEAAGDFGLARENYGRSIGEGDFAEFKNDARFRIANLYLKETRYIEAKEKFGEIARDAEERETKLGMGADIKIAEVFYLQAREMDGKRGKDPKKLEETIAQYIKAFDQFQDIRKNRVETMHMLLDNGYVEPQKTIDLLSDLGVRLSVLKDYDSAIKVYNYTLGRLETYDKRPKAKKTFTVIVDPLIQKKAEAYVALGEKRKAAETYETMPGVSPKWRQSLMRAAQLYYESGAWTDAVRAYKLFVLKYDGDPETAKANYHIGYSYKQLGQYDDARKWFAENTRWTFTNGAEVLKEPMDQGSDSPYKDSLFAYYSMYELGNMYFAQHLLEEPVEARKQLELAEKQFDAILNDGRFTPKAAVWKDSVYKLGHVQYLLDKYEDSIKYLNEAIERYPNHPWRFEAQFNLGNAYLNLKKYPDAIRHLNEVMNADRQYTLDEKAVKYENMRAEAQGVAARLKHIEREINKMIEKEKTRRETENRIKRYANLSIADIHMQEGKYQPALHQLQNAFDRYRRTTDAPWIKYQIGQCYTQLKQPERARIAFNESKKLFENLKTQANDKQTQKLAEDWDLPFWTQYVDWTKDSNKWYTDQTAENEQFYQNL